jgi:hypothetical protein
MPASAPMNGLWNSLTANPAKKPRVEIGHFGKTK